MQPPLNNSRPEILVFEPEEDGHRGEWLRHLAAFAAADHRPYTTWFAVPPDTAKALAAEFGEVRLHFLPLGERERKLCALKPRALGAFFRWWSMRRALREARAEAGLFLWMDPLVWPLSLGLGAGGARLSGILFHPTSHYPALTGTRARPGEWVRDVRKAVLDRLMLHNPAVSAVLSLDPYFPAHLPSDKLSTIDDPVHPTSGATTAPFLDALPEGRMIFGLFGVLTARKGVVALLDAIARLPAPVQRRAAFVLAGRLDPQLTETVAQARRALPPEACVILEDRHLATGEIEALVDRSDVVLAPYQRTVGSSGVMLWAAGAGKPLLTQDYGLIGRLVRDYGLGRGVDTTDSAALAAALAAMINNPTAGFDPDRARAFAGARPPDNFARTAIDALLRPMPQPGHSSGRTVSAGLRA